MADLQKSAMISVHDNYHVCDSHTHTHKRQQMGETNGGGAQRISNQQKEQQFSLA